MAGLVSVEHRLIRQRMLQLFIGGRHRRTRLFPRVLGAAQADGDLQDAFQEALHHQPGHAAHHGQVGNQRGELGAELANELIGQRRDGRHPAGGTLPPMTSVLRDVRRDHGQLRDLMTPRVPNAVLRGQAVRTLATRVGHQIDECIHAFDGDGRTMAPGMARLTACRTLTLHASPADTLFAREAIR
jgi:hypothetical protein